jgi:hypothetical protein
MAALDFGGADVAFSLVQGFFGQAARAKWRLLTLIDQL